MVAATTNEELADLLERIADLLRAQGANGYRVRAYRSAGRTARTHDEPLVDVFERGGTAALVALPTIGRSIAAIVEEYAHSGRCGLLARLEGHTSPEDLFTTVSGVGPELAHRIHEVLGVETLEELEVAAHDGRLEAVPGIGPRRARAIRDSLAATLSRAARRRARRRGSPPPSERPPVATLLELDGEYRERAQAGELPTIAPRRFNPRGESWLPVLHIDRHGWAFSALFSNTARAHELGRTRDWVVIHWERDGLEDRCTVVTELAGALAGRRVVRGREAECAHLQ